MNRKTRFLQFVIAPVFAAALIFRIAQAIQQEEPSEASKWYVPESSASSSTLMESAGLNWQEAYSKFREQPSNSEAARQLREAVQTTPDDENARMALGIVERDTGNWKEAEIAFTEVLKINPNRAGALWNLGRLAQQKGALDEAARYFEKSAGANTKAWQPVYALGQVRQQQGRKDEAKRMILKSKSLGGGDTDRRGGMDGFKTEIGLVVQFLEWD